MADSLNLDELKAKAEGLVKSITADTDLMSSFTKDPVGTIEKKLGIDLPDEQINQLIKLIQDNLGEVAKSGILDKIKGLFGK